MTRGRIESIDLLRGLAIALVMARHAFPEALPGAGVVGVVMFFALSGHLIAGVLLDELSATGSLRLRRFYLRRARRLVPALVTMLIGFTLVTLLLDPLDDARLLPSTWLVALTWTANLPGRPETSDAAFHLWTLAGEEQFYLVLPALLLLGWRRGRLGLAIAVAAVGALLACAATTWWLREVPDNAYVLPTSWAVAFVVGVASRWARDRLPAPGPTAGATALLLLAALSALPVRGHVWTYLLVGPVVAASTAVLLLAWQSWTRVRHPWLRPLVALGTVSYAAYLWNYPLTLWLRPYTEWAGVLAAVLTLVAATASWHLVEKPLARRTGRSRTARTDEREKVPQC